MIRKRLLLALILILSFMGFLVEGCTSSSPVPSGSPKPAAAPHVFQWRVQHLWTVGTSAHNKVVEFAELLKQMSGGRIVLTPFAANALVPNAEAMAATGKGTLDMAITYGGYYSGLITIGDIEAGIPYTFRDYEDAYNFWYNKDFRFLDLSRQAYAEQNVYFVAPYFNVGHVLVSNVAVRKPEDWKGLKFRASGGAAKWLKQMGATPVSLPLPETYQALANRTVDGVDQGNLETNWDLKFHEVSKYTLWPYISRVLACNFLVNADKWKALPDDLKAILEVAAVYSSFNKFYEQDFGEQAYRTKLVDYGVQIIQWDDAMIASNQKGIKPLLDEIAAKGGRATQAVELMYKFLKFRGYIR